jgi:aerobic C4-dicarboxylate transport protein
MALKPLGDGYIRLIKMIIGPVVFVTVVTGIASLGDLRKVGRVGGKTLVYFEVMSTFALMLGLAAGHLLEPGRGIDVAAVKGADISQYATAARTQTVPDFLLHMIPDTALGPFATGDMLQILVVAALTGVALALAGARGARLLALLEDGGVVLFRIVGLIVRVAPLGAFGAMAFTVGKFGVGALAAMGRLMGAVYLAMALFIGVVLAIVARMAGFSLLALLRHIRGELLVVLGTSSSETALPSVMERLVTFGCGRGIVGLVIPTGYSFNLDGTSIYLSMAALFIAQAYGVELSFGRELMLLGILLVTSKGAAAVTGSGFVTLAATLAATGILPVEGVALLLGVDRFMSEARAITNLIGNSVATVVIARMEGDFHPPGRADAL